MDSQEEMGTYLALDPAALMPRGRRCLKASGPTTGRRADPMPVRHAPPACKVFFSASIRTYFVRRDSDLDAFESELIHWPTGIAPWDSFYSGRYLMTDLAGKTALVTGASRGIGRATALGLANAGAQILVRWGVRTPTPNSERFES